MAKKDSRSSREADLAAARQELAKKFGTGAVIGSDAADVETLSTGLILLDAALGCGGLPRGRLVELFGAESSGKSTIALSTAAQALALDEAVAYLDYEHSFDAAFASLFGIDVADPRFLWSQPETAEEGFQIVEHLLSKRLVSVVIFDSLAAMPTQRELKADVDDVLIAPLARVMASEGRRLVPLADESGAIIFFVNHVREKIGGFNPTGQPVKTTPGGRGLKFYASVRIEAAEIGKLRGNVIDLKTGKPVKGIVGTRHEAVVRKNKLAPPSKRAQFIIRDGRGLCEPQIVAEIAVERGMVKKSGNSYMLDEHKFVGLDALVDQLYADAERYATLREQVQVALRETATAVAADDEEDE